MEEAEIKVRIAGLEEVIRTSELEIKKLEDRLRIINFFGELNDSAYDHYWIISLDNINKEIDSKVWNIINFHTKIRYEFVSSKGKMIMTPYTDDITDFEYIVHKYANPFLESECQDAFNYTSMNVLRYDDFYNLSDDEVMYHSSEEMKWTEVSPGVLKTTLHVYPVVTLIYRKKDVTDKISV